MSNNSIWIHFVVMGLVLVSTGKNLGGIGYILRFDDMPFGKNLSAL